MDISRLAVCGDADMDRGLALFRGLGLLAEEDDAEGGSWHMAAWFLDKLNVFSTGMLRSKMMQISKIEPNRDLFSVRAKQVTIKA